MLSITCNRMEKNQPPAQIFFWNAYAKAMSQPPRSLQGMRREKKKIAKSSKNKAFVRTQKPWQLMSRLFNQQKKLPFHSLLNLLPSHIKT